jgi:hypothetical protein
MNISQIAAGMLIAYGLISIIYTFTTHGGTFLQIITNFVILVTGLGQYQGFLLSLPIYGSEESLS